MFARSSWQNMEENSVDSRAFGCYSNTTVSTALFTVLTAFAVVCVVLTCGLWTCGGNVCVTFACAIFCILYGALHNCMHVV